jgi:hypothetical protein
MNINQAARGHNKRESQKKKKWMMHLTKNTKEMDDLLKESG